MLPAGNENRLACASLRGCVQHAQGTLHVYPPITIKELVRFARAEQSRSVVHRSGLLTGHSLLQGGLITNVRRLSSHTGRDRLTLPAGEIMHHLVSSM